jgi:hypothetical protein
MTVIFNNIKTLLLHRIYHQSCCNNAFNSPKTRNKQHCKGTCYFYCTRNKQLCKIHYSSHFLLYKEQDQTTRRFYALKTFSAMKKERVKAEVSQGKTSDSHSSHGNMVRKKFRKR